MCVRIIGQIRKQNEWERSTCEMVRKEYSAGAVKLSFWFLEFKKTVELLANGTEMTEVRRQALEENLYAAPSADRAKQIFQTVSARIQSLDESFYPIFKRGIYPARSFWH